MVVRWLVLSLGVALLSSTVPGRAAAVDWVTVGDPGNACDAQPQGCFGSVGTPFKIGAYEVTNAQYVEFLNAVDPTGANVLELYNPLMTYDPNAELLFERQHGGIALVPENPDGERYEVKEGYADRPVLYVSFFDAVRFANWLNNGQGAASTETGSYTLLGGTAVPSNGPSVTREPAAEVFLPNEDEWYKAAYYDETAGSWLDFPGGTDAEMVCDVPGSTPNTANCNGGLNVGTLTDVGAYTGSPSPAGTYDQGGNAWEWNETVVGSERVLRGGGWALQPSFTGADVRFGFDPATGEFWDVGFRVASAFPACGDGVDNDGDGLVDYPDDPGCTSPTDTSEQDPTLPCDDGIDNDGDGLIDLEDPGCRDPSWPLENPECQDGIDNEGDGAIDFDGGASLNGGVPIAGPDPQCMDQPWRNSERPKKSCGLGFEIAALLPALVWFHRRRGPTAPGTRRGTTASST